MSTLSASNITSGFIDLATFDELEKYMYGGNGATVYFVRDTRKATWFTQVPVSLSRSSGTADFGQDWSVSISRAGDYLLQTWLRFTLPAVQLNSANIPAQSATSNYRLRWTKNVGHNLIRECNITFNDLVAARFDSYHLDFWSAFTTPAGKNGGYQNMIGNIAPLTNPTWTASQTDIIPITGPSTLQSQLASQPTVVNVPLPFFFSRDSGLALPTAALPYNDMRINFSFRNWTELLICDNAAAQNTVSGGVTTGVAFNVTLTSSMLVGGAPSLTNVNVWANYAIVSNDERRRMGCAPRDILIEQVQTAPRQTFNPAVTAAGTSYDIRFSHAIKVLFFGVRNITVSPDWSNYTTSSAGYTLVAPGTPVVLTTPPGTGNYAYDPLTNVSLIYENTSRLSAMGVDYYSLVNPWYCAPVIISNACGFHTYSYSLNFGAADPMGSTNYGKLTNVSIVLFPSAFATASLGTAGIFNASTVLQTQRASGADYAQRYEFILTAVNNNIIRVSGGALGFPVL